MKKSSWLFDRSSSCSKFKHVGHLFPSLFNQRTSESVCLYCSKPEPPILMKLAALFLALGFWVRSSDDEMKDPSQGTEKAFKSFHSKWGLSEEDPCPLSLPLSLLAFESQCPFFVCTSRWQWKLSKLQARPKSPLFRRSLTNRIGKNSSNLDC